MLKCSYKHISLAKIGNFESENEDNILIPSISEITNDPLIRFAIADGATESSFSKEWSELLVQSYKDKSFHLDNLPATITSISDIWHSMINIIELPWYAQQKAENGAFSTFLGVTLDLIECKLEAIAIGDCTLFQIRNNELAKSFPLTRAEEYGNVPHLFSSNKKYQADFEKAVKYFEGQILNNDLFILATDALAMWVFKSVIDGKKPWHRLDKLLNNEENRTDSFSKWAKNKIKKKELKNDDITLIIINIE